MKEQAIPIRLADPAGPDADVSKPFEARERRRADQLTDDYLLPGLASGLELARPDRLVFPPTWLGHIPFAFWLVDVFRPRTLVELGVHSGNSYCAFLQAVRILGLPTRCYGIDHWKGDDHAMHYGEQVYSELLSYHDPRYGNFSSLLRHSFDEGVKFFSDGSIDLLHLDGFHTYEAVTHDFDTWLPKMSSRGIMLFHDTNVRERDFGVWRFWKDLAARYPNFEFAHSYGLGIAFVGSDPLPRSLNAMFNLGERDGAAKFRAYFSRLGASITEQSASMKQEGEAVEALRVKLKTNEELVASLQQTLAAESQHRAGVLREQTINATRLWIALSERNRELVSARADTHRALAELERIMKSTGWRLSEPVRSFARRHPSFAQKIWKILNSPIGPFRDGKP